MDRINGCNTLISWKSWPHLAKRHSNMTESGIEFPLKSHGLYCLLSLLRMGKYNPVSFLRMSTVYGKMSTVTMLAPIRISNLESQSKCLYVGLGVGNSDKTVWKDWILSNGFSKLRRNRLFYKVSTQRTPNLRSWISHMMASLLVWKMMSWLSSCGIVRVAG